MDGFNVEVFRKCAITIFERVKCIRHFYGEQLSSERTGTVSAARLFYALSAPHLHNIRADREVDDALSWYCYYVDSVLRLASIAKNSVLDGNLTLRHYPSRFPLIQDEIQEWIDAVPNTDLFQDCAEWESTDSKWHDAICYPPGDVTLNDAEAWVESAGITTAAELRELLGMKTDHPNHADQSPAPASQVKPVSRFEAQEAEILATIHAAGHDPLSLPERQPGKPGVKLQVRDRLVGKSKNFPKSGSQFDKAWIRLRANRQIVD